MEDLEAAATLAFHGVAYVVTVGVERQELCVQVEVEDAAAPQDACWTARFPSDYIEELTRKTGNFKRFAVFVSMLLSALEQRSDAVFVDLLTAADLELYRKRKLGRAGDSSHGTPTINGNGNGNNSKRYLILTYAVEFDRVHYPLPLTLVQSPSPDMLQRTIRRLRQALAQSKSSDAPSDQRLADENAALREENRCLKSTLKQYCGGDPGGSENVNRSNVGFPDLASFDLQRELEASVRENKELLAIYQQHREDTAIETARLRAEIKQLKMKNQANSNVDDDHESLLDLRRSVEQEREEAKRKLKEGSAAIQETLVQMVQMKAQLEESQLKNRELMRQLAVLRANAPNGQSRAVRSRFASNNGRASPGPRPLDRQPLQSSPRPVNRRSFDDTLRFNRRPIDYQSSDDEQESHTSAASLQGRRVGRQRPFQRFDPTAYQQERERKLQARATGPRTFGAGAGSARTRRNSAAGYTSDSSAGGYSSAGSHESKGSSQSARFRGRPSVRRQRESDSRLASPKRPAAPDDLPPRLRSPMGRPQPPSRSASRGRSPSPAGSRTPSSVTGVNNHARVAGDRRGNPERNHADKPELSIDKRHNDRTPTAAGSAQLRRTPQRQATLQRALQDTSMDSFSDIDDRLTALQQFLREAKQGGGAASNIGARSPATTAN